MWAFEIAVLVEVALLLVVSPSQRIEAQTDASLSNSPAAELLALARTAPNWPYIWLAKLESDTPKGKTISDSADWEGRRLFLKGVAYFCLVPEYSRRRDFNQRLQILEKTLDNWKAAAAAFQKSGHAAESRKIARARGRVFQRYLNEKRTRRYRGQTLAGVFGGPKFRPCAAQETSFVAHVVCALKNAKSVQTY